MAKKSTPEEIPLFEQAVAELEQIVRRLEQGGNSLQDDLGDYGRAIQLIKLCHSRLAQAESSVQLLSGIDADGNPILETYQQASPNSEVASLEEKQADRSRRRSARQDDEF